MHYAQQGIRADMTNSTQTPDITIGYSGIRVFIIDVPDQPSQTLRYSYVGYVITYDTYIINLSVRHPGRGADAVDTNNTNLVLRCPGRNMLPLFLKDTNVNIKMSGHQVPLYKDTTHGSQLVMLAHTKVQSLRRNITMTSPISQVRIISNINHFQTEKLFF